MSQLNNNSESGFIQCSDFCPGDVSKVLLAQITATFCLFKHTISENVFYNTYLS